MAEVRGSLVLTFLSVCETLGLNLLRYGHRKVEEGPEIEENVVAPYLMYK